MDLQLHGAFARELQWLDVSREGGLDGLVAELAAGRATDDPFPVEATQRLREFAWEATANSRVEPDAGGEVQAQPIDFLLLGSVLKAEGGPDWAVMGTYAVGVPMGLGVDLPYHA